MGESSSGKGKFVVVVVGGLGVVGDHDHDVDVVHPSSDEGTHVATGDEGSPVTVLQKGGDSGGDAV